MGHQRKQQVQHEVILVLMGWEEKEGWVNIANSKYNMGQTGPDGEGGKEGWVNIGNRKTCMDHTGPYGVGRKVRCGTRISIGGHMGLMVHRG